MGLLWSGSATAEDWFSCWPQDGKGVSSLPPRRCKHFLYWALSCHWSMAGVGIESCSFPESFRHTMKFYYCLTPEGGGRKPYSQKARRAGIWASMAWDRNVMNNLEDGSHLEKVQIRSYRSLIKMRKWTSDLVVVFPDKDDWVVLHVHEQWKKQRDRISSRDHVL